MYALDSAGYNIAKISFITQRSVNTKYYSTLENDVTSHIALVIEIHSGAQR